jgi:hypothetical protein
VPQRRSPHQKEEDNGGEQSPDHSCWVTYDSGILHRLGQVKRMRKTQAASGVSDFDKICAQIHFDIVGFVDQVGDTHVFFSTRLCRNRSTSCLFVCLFVC